MGAALEDSFLTPGFFDRSWPEQHAPDVADRGLLNALLATGHPVVGLPDEFLRPPAEEGDEHPQGRIRTLPEMGEDFDDYMYARVLREALARTLGLPLDVKAGAEDALTERYRDVIKDPTPWS